MDLNRLKNHDWLITAISLILLSVGAFIIFSTTYNASSAASGAGTLPKQIIFIIFGLIIYFILAITDFQWFQNRTVLLILYVVIFALLVFVKLFGTQIAGTNRWIDIGFFSFQPSEYAKIIIVLLTAGTFALNEKVIQSKVIKFHDHRQTTSIFSRLTGNLQQTFPFIYRLLQNALLVIPVIILILIQPSLGNAIITCALWLFTVLLLIPEEEQSKVLVFFMTIVLEIIIFVQFLTYNQEANIFEFLKDFNSLNFLVIGTCLVLIALILFIIKIRPLTALIFTIIALLLTSGFIFSWNQVLKPYQKDRITTFLQGPEADPTNSGFQVIQSKIAIGSGRLSGRGFLQGTQSSLNVLTQAHTDFIFAAMSEQLGFVGAAIILLLYTFLILKIIKIGLETTNKFGKIVALGIAILLLLHIFINIGMNLGQLPVTGIPLPLMSYGGSATFMTLIGLGIVQSIGSSRKSVDIADNLMLRSRSLQIN